MNNKVIVITGARKGIGRALTEYYLDQGNLVIGCSRQKSDLVHKNYIHYELDVADESAVVEMVRNIKKQFGKIDILLNNAGIASMNHFLTTSYQSVQNIFATNFFGTFLFTREVAKIMIKQNFGRIVNFATIATPLRLEGEAIYAASKSAIENLTQTVAKELAPYNITVNAVGPTPIETDLIKNVPKNKIDDLLQKQAIKRLGTFEDVKNIIDFFISEKSEFITGQIIYLGGVF